MPRLIKEIAVEIENDWERPYFGAVPYIEAMKSLNDVRSLFHFDDGKTIIIYFLSNANTWRGETAKRIKSELKALL